MANLALATRGGSIKTLAETAMRQKATLDNRRRREREQAAAMMQAGVALVGACAAGAADAVFGEGNEDAEVGDVPLVPVVSGLLALTGLFPGKVPGARWFSAIGLGGACYSAGNFTRDLVEDALEE